MPGSHGCCRRCHCVYPRYRRPTYRVYCTVLTFPGGQRTPRKTLDRLSPFAPVCLDGLLRTAAALVTDAGFLSSKNPTPRRSSRRAWSSEVLCQGFWSMSPPKSSPVSVLFNMSWFWLRPDDAMPQPDIRIRTRLTVAVYVVRRHTIHTPPCIAWLDHRLQRPVHTSAPPSILLRTGCNGTRMARYGVSLL